LARLLTLDISLSSRSAYQSSRVSGVALGGSLSLGRLCRLISLYINKQTCLSRLLASVVCSYRRSPLNGSRGSGSCKLVVASTYNTIIGRPCSPPRQHMYTQANHPTQTFPQTLGSLVVVFVAGLCLANKQTLPLSSYNLYDRTLPARMSSHSPQALYRDKCLELSGFCSLFKRNMDGMVSPTHHNHTLGCSRKQIAHRPTGPWWSLLGSCLSIPHGLLCLLHLRTLLSQLSRLFPNFLYICCVTCSFSHLS